MQSQTKTIAQFTCTSYRGCVVTESATSGTVSAVNLAKLDRICLDDDKVTVTCFYVGVSDSAYIQFIFDTTDDANTFKSYLTDQLHSYYARLTHVPTLD